MNQLYKGKWSGNEGELLKDDGSFTSNALLWNRKLERLTTVQWAKAFVVLEDKIVNDVRDGKQSWPPSYAEFIGYALSDEETGIANVRQAYKEATDNFGTVGHSTWSHMVVYTAAKATGSYMLKMRTEKESFSVFKSNFEDALTKFRNGDTLDAIPALPKPEDVKPRTTREERNKSAQKHLKDIKGLFE